MQCKKYMYMVFPLDAVVENDETVYTKMFHLEALK